jgi:hypothetical protein
MTIPGVETAVKGLSASPVLLIIAVLNVGMVFALMYVASSQRDERKELTQYLISCQKGAVQ